jgi:hypothetical protein
MKAYKCDECCEYKQGAPAGILYDNANSPESVRYDLCGECLENILKVVKGQAYVTTDEEISSAVKKIESEIVSAVFEDGEPDDYRKWGADIPYRKGELVRYQGQLYEILTNHVSSRLNVPGYCEKYKPVKEPGLFEPEGYGMNAEA